MLMPRRLGLAEAVNWSLAPLSLASICPRSMALTVVPSVTGLKGLVWGRVAGLVCRSRSIFSWRSQRTTAAS